MSNKVNKSAQRVLKSAVLTTLKIVAASTLLASASLSAFAQECLSDGLETTPNVNLIEVSELHMMLSDIESHEQVTAVCQGFLGPGVSGEALCILSDSSFDDVAKILNVEGEVDDQLQLELLMDAASILIGTCLTGLAHQMDINFSQGHPIVLGQHRAITEIISMNQIKWKRTLAIELSYGLEGYNVQCDLILLFTEESMKMMNSKLAHLLEDF